MALNKDETKVRYVKGMFSHISPDYDYMNRLMSLGRDMSWRRLLLAKAGVHRGGMLLDVGTGQVILHWSRCLYRSCCARDSSGLH